MFFCNLQQSGELSSAHRAIVCFGKPSENISDQAQLTTLEAYTIQAPQKERFGLPLRGYLRVAKGRTWLSRFPAVITKFGLIGNPATRNASATQVLHVLRTLNLPSAE